jgi:hypothetical protein
MLERTLSGLRRQEPNFSLANRAGDSLVHNLACTLNAYQHMLLGCGSNVEWALPVQSPQPKSMAIKELLMLNRFRTLHIGRDQAIYSSPPHMEQLERFPTTRALLRVVQGGFLLRRKPLDRAPSVYSKWRIAIAGIAIYGWPRGTQARSPLRT